MNKLILYSIVNLVNLPVWLGIVILTYSTLYITFLFMTILSYTLSVFYLFVMWLYELRLYLSKHNEEKYNQIKKCKFYTTLRERVFKYVFLISLTVCTCYWGLCLGGDQIMSTKDQNLFLNIYLHAIIGLQILCELLLTERKHLPEMFIQDFLISNFIITVYSTILIIVAKSYELYIYPFLRLEINQILAINIVMLIISFNIYQFFHFILEKKQKVSAEWSENNTDLGVNNSALLKIGI